MSNRNNTFAKRQREQALKDRARDKEARRAARKADPRVTKGPQIDWSAAVPFGEAQPTTAAPAPAPSEGAAPDAPSEGDPTAPDE